MSRVTSRSGFIDYVYEVGYPPNFVLEPNRIESNYDYIYSLTRSDVVKHQRDSLGWRPPGPYRAQLSSIEFWKGTLDRVYYDYTGVKRNTYRYSGGLSGNVLPNYRISDDLKTFPSGLFARSEVKALLKARDQKVNLSLTFAEMHKSSDMIISRVTQLYRGYREARKGNFKAAAVALGVGKSKRNAKTWLELQYGWLPLLSDIHGGYEELTRKARTNGLLFNVKSTVSEPVEYVTDNSVPRRSEIVTVRGIHSAQVSLWFTVKYENLQAASRVGLTNPLEIAWELTPWSFVVDWLIPVGDILGAMTATQGLDFKSGTRTQYTKLNLVGKAKFLGGRSPSGDVNDDKGEAYCGEEYMFMDRTVYTGSPVPSLYVKNPFSVSHGLNALALLRTLF